MQFFGQKQHIYAILTLQTQKVLSTCNYNLMAINVELSSS